MLPQLWKSIFIRLLFGLVLIGLLLFPLPASAAQNLKVYYAGPQGGMSQALALDWQVELVSDLAQADVIVLNGVIPEREAIRQRVQAGAGLVLALGPDLTAGQVGALLGETVQLEQKADPLSLNPVNPSDNPLVKEIVWTRCCVRSLTNVAISARPRCGSASLLTPKALHPWWRALRTIRSYWAKSSQARAGFTC